ncbi:MAG TPA: MG2 domain-containing protein [Verrucomicrobiota bacterium]|nr:MG2 domain-containing protein [Verrucomicrobiota bacterium]HNU50835.1 MG2 domain-containing protein [Verrucomicrobiota bacterium]
MNPPEPVFCLSPRSWIALLAAALCLAPRAWGAETTPLDPLRADMRAERFDSAIATADTIIAAKHPQADEAHYLKTLALFHAKRFPEAAAAADQLAFAFPESVWRHKAVFLKAQALIEQKQFQPAAALYQAEAARLLAADRKQELVGVIVAFAEKLSAQPDPRMPDAPRPDFPKAHGLFTKALGMEISRDLRDDLVFKKARAIQQAGNFGQAIQDYQAYLTEFDPGWTGPAGSGTARLPLQNPPPAGKHLAMARYRLGESQIQAGHLAAGRMELEDLLKLTAARAGASNPLEIELSTQEGKRLPQDIRWLLVQSHFVPSSGGGAANKTAPAGESSGRARGRSSADPVLFTLREGEPDAALRVCRSFLEACPEGSRAVRAAWMIAETLETAGRADDAIQAYRDVIAGRGFQPETAEAAERLDEELGATPAAHLANLRMRALFRIGSILAQQKKNEEAIAAWKTYVKDHPNGPQWSDSQSALIDAEYQMGLDAVISQNEALGLERFEEFLRAHPLDARSPRILYLFGAVHEARTRALEESRGDRAAIEAGYRKAIGEWTKLTSKYPQSPEARSALMKTAGIHEEKLGEYETALGIYRRLADEFKHGDAQAAMVRLTRKSLELSADRTFRSNEKAVVKLRLRNIEKATFRLHKLDLQAYFRKMHGIGGVEGLDVSLIQPDTTWEFKPEGYAKYKPFDQEVEVPFPDSEPGAYVVTAGDDDWEATVLVLRSDLEMIVKSSRREVLAFVQNMLTGKPAAGIDILVSDGQAVAASGKTGEDGVFKTALESLQNLADIRLFALGNGHAASFNLELSGLELSSGLTPKGYLYTDRPAYQPGETVAVRGILREVRNAAYAVPENGEFKVSVLDPQGRLLSEQTVKLSRFGTFDSAFALPAGAASGQYTLAAHQDRKGHEPLHFQGTFEVRPLTLAKIKLAIEFPRRVWFRGESIEANLQVAYYWGAPLAGRPLRCTLPDGRTQQVTTDAQGKARLLFDTAGMRPGTALRFAASLDGEDVAASETVTLARLGFGIAAKPSQPVVIAGEPFDLAITATGADGKPVGEPLNVAVFRVEKPKASPLLAILPWRETEGPQSAEVKVSESEVRTDPATGKAVAPLTLNQGGVYRLRTTGTDRFGQTITHQCQVEVSDATDAVKLRLFAETATLKVGMNTRARLHSRMDKGLALVTFEGETILHHRILELKQDYHDIAIAVGHELFPNFRLAVAAMDGRDLRAAVKDFTVERELKVLVKPLKDAFLPGETGHVEVGVTDQSGRPVEAELSLALVNEALFAICPDPLMPILDYFQKDAWRHAEFKLGATCAFRYPGKTRPVSKDVVQEAERVTRGLAEVQQLAALGRPVAPAPPQSVAAPSGGRQAIRANGALRMRSAAGSEVSGFADFDADGAMDLGLVDRKAKPAEGGAFFFSRSVEGEAPEASARREIKGEGRWLPSVVTGADGKATAAIPMPETTTAWRLTARGCTVETLVGQTTAATLTRKDFFVELKTPSFAREGDGLRVVGRAHNLGKNAGPVTLQLRVLDAADKTKVIAQREKTLDLEPQSSAETTFDLVTVPAVLGLVTELTGTAGPHNDALVLEIPVRPWGLPYAAHAGGTAEADTAAVLGLPGDRSYASLWMSVALGPDLRTAVLDMALRRGGAGPSDPMARLRPPGWGDTPANDLLAAAAGLRYALAGQIGESYSRPLADRARALVATLVASQTAEGQWTCQSLGHLTTARVFWALIEARASGMVVGKETLDKAAAALLKQFEGCDANDNDSKAVILHALSTDRRADFAHCNRLYRDRQALGNSALAHLARAFFNLERREIASELATLLESKVKVDAGTSVAWEGGCRLVWLNDTDETTAMVLLALAETKPGSNAAAAAAQSLLKAHGCFGFPNPRAHGPAVAALCLWFGQGLPQTTDLEIDVAVNGRAIGVVAGAGTFGLHHLPVPADVLKADKNVVEFKMRGRGRYTYAATLYGFSPDVKASPPNITPCMEHVRHLHAQLEYRGKPIGADSSSPVKHLENGQRFRVALRTERGHSGDGRRYALEVALPPGTRLDEGTLRAEPNWVTGRELTDSTLTLFFDRWLHSVSFELSGTAPGTFRMLPPVIRELGNPAFMSVGPVTELTVLGGGETSPDPYAMNISEHYALGKCHFDDGDFGTALEHLAAVHKDNPKHNESELARMLLWIYTSPKFYDARSIVDRFEVLRERYPQLEIPFDKILTVGRAYTDLGEFERSWLVYRAAMAASFNNDSAISAVLEDEGRFLGSIDFQERVWREYPDTAEVLSSYFALSQLLYEKAPKAHELPKEDGVQPEKIAMLRRTAGLLVSFLAMHPRDPLADDAGFSLANCHLSLKNYPLVVALSGEFAQQYPDSPLAPGFQYMAALGLFWQHQYADALAAATVVADGDSKDRDVARYIVGQIHHAEGKPQQAIEWYTKVKTLYPDAAEAIAYFEQKRIALDEVSVIRPRQPVDLTLKYRNIKEAALQVYRVDLMKLYLQQKNLSAITRVQLAGIRPELEQTTALGDGRDYLEKTRTLSLPLKDEAAYLVICRGDDLFTSGMVLITPLKIEVQEDAASGRVRANVLDADKGGYRPEVHIKVIGSADTEFRSGETDLRGLFVADAVRGKATVIAREGESRYAFFRGETWLGAPLNAPAAPAAQPATPGPSIDYLNNLNYENTRIQELNRGRFDLQRRQAPAKGVQMEQAF